MQEAISKFMECIEAQERSGFTDIHRFLQRLPVPVPVGRVPLTPFFWKVTQLQLSHACSAATSASVRIQASRLWVEGEEAMCRRLIHGCGSLGQTAVRKETAHSAQKLTEQACSEDKTESQVGSRMIRSKVWCVTVYPSMYQYVPVYTKFTTHIVTEDF